MSVTDISAAKWDRTDRPEDLDPLDAVRAALREIEQGEARHIIVCIAKKPDDGEYGSRARFLQAGDYDCCGQLGLLERVKAMLLEA